MYDDDKIRALKASIERTEARLQEVVQKAGTLNFATNPAPNPEQSFRN